VIVRGKVPNIESSARSREAIIITEMPYQVNKAAMVERIAELVREKRIEGIADLRDESDRDGMRVVIELKRDASGRRGAQPALPLHRRCRASSFGVNALALDRGRPSR
jgi:DNA gyrase subunit A